MRWCLSDMLKDFEWGLREVGLCHFACLHGMCSSLSWLVGYTHT